MGLIVSLGIFTSHATVIDTFKITQYKITNHQIKRCLSKIAEEESKKHERQVDFVVVNYTQKNIEYLFVGCNTLPWLSFYRYFYEIEDNELVGCAYFNRSSCFLFGKNIHKYLSDSTGIVSVVDSNQIISPLIGSEAMFNKWKEELDRMFFRYDPPVWIFKKRKRKFERIYNDEYDYVPITLYLQNGKRPDI